MTSTGFNAGLGDLNRNSSRVLKPPGGGHSDIFGTEIEEKPRKQNKNQMISNIFGNIEEKKLVTDCTPRKMSSIPIGTDINDENQTPAKWKPPPTLPGYDSVSELPKEISRKLETSHAPEENNSEKNVKIQRNRVPPGGYSSALW